MRRTEGERQTSNDSNDLRHVAAACGDTIFVAGDRVQTDAIAVPFSMGRDLLCIYSKKHIENPPELKGEKSKHNRLVMKTMAKLFKEGGKCICGRN